MTSIPVHTLNVTVVSGAIVISHHGDLTIDNLPAYIDFDLQTTNQHDTIAGIKISSSAGNVTDQTPSEDTAGDWYELTCFKISHSSDRRTLRLLDEIRTAIEWDIQWYYCLGVKLEGHSHPIWSDPKIYNRGDEFVRNLPGAPGKE
ncbi:MAG: hypothetical protein MI919_26350 [Holophagales bacterium]|nr:hypothetical protein [Holophagales bacterium]